MFQIISRREAHEQGLLRFFTGVPCRNGHLAERYVNQGQCLLCVSKYRKFAPNPYTSELVPWSPTTVYVPRTVTPELYAELQTYIEQCVEAWVTHKELATGNIPFAYSKRREYLADRARKEAEHAAAMAKRGAP